MSRVQVGVVGYGVIGQRLADGVNLQEDMDLVGVVDIAPTLSIRAMFDSGQPYPLYVVSDENRAAFEKEGFPVQGDLDDLLGKVDIVLDATPGGGRKSATAPGVPPALTPSKAYWAASGSVTLRSVRLRTCRSG